MAERAGIVVDGEAAAAQPRRLSALMRSGREGRQKRP
jgi:hypothetical protein